MADGEDVHERSWQPDDPLTQAPRLQRCRTFANCLTITAAATAKLSLARLKLDCSIRCRFRRDLAHAMPRAVGRKCEVSVVELPQCRTVPDRHDRGAGQPLAEQPIERRFTRLVERGGRLVEEHDIGRM